jgi:hypothetical protein
MDNRFPSQGGYFLYGTPIDFLEGGRRVENVFDFTGTQFTDSQQVFPGKLHGLPSMMSGVVKATPAASIGI